MNKKIKVDTETFNKVSELVDKEQHENFTKNLNADVKKKLDETDKLILKVESNSIENENSNLHIIKNLSVDLKENLPLNRFYEGTNFKSLKEFEFKNSLMLKFTNKTLCFLLGKNADTIQRDNPLYFRTLRDIAPSVILNLIHNVIIIKDNNCFNDPVGRKPKMINFDFKKLYKYVKKPKNVSDDITAKEYFNSKFNKEGKDTDYITAETFNDIAKFILMKVEKSEADVPLLTKLNAVNSYIEAGNNYFSDVQQLEQIEASKECIFNLLSVANNSTKYDVLIETLIHLTDENTFDEFKQHIQSLSNQNVKMYQAVKFDKTNKAKYIKAETTDTFLKQLKAV